MDMIYTTMEKNVNNVKKLIEHTIIQIKNQI